MSDAVALERIDSSVERDRKARELLRSRGRTTAVKTPDPDWKRVGIAFALLIAVFFVAMALAKTPEYEKLSEAVLRFLSFCTRVYSLFLELKLRSRAKSGGDIANFLFA